MKRESLTRIRGIIRKEGRLATPPMGRVITSRRDRERSARPSSRELFEGAESEEEERQR